MTLHIRDLEFKMSKSSVNYSTHPSYLIC